MHVTCVLSRLETRCDIINPSKHHAISYCKRTVRTKLDIDDVLAAAKELARQKHLSAGQVVSQRSENALQDADSTKHSVAGFRPFPAGKAVIINEAVNRLRDAEGV